MIVTLTALSQRGVVHEYEGIFGASGAYHWH